MIPDRTSWEAVGNDRQDRQRLGPGLVLAQAAEHVLDADHGIVDKLADGDGETAQGHGVDGEPEQVKDDHRDEDGNRDRGERNGGGAPVEQEQEQHGGDDDEGLDQDPQHVVDRDLDEGGLPEQHVDGGDVLREHALQVGERRLDLGGELEGVGIGLLLHGQDHGRLAHVAGIAALHARRIVDGRDLAETNGDALAVDDGQVLQVLQPRGAAEIADEVFARMLIDEAARRVRPELPERRSRPRCG